MTEPAEPDRPPLDDVPPPDSAMNTAATLRSWLLLAGEKEKAVNDLEAEHTCLLVKQRFDAAKLDELEEQPEWLEGLLAHKRWRALLCSLFRRAGVLCRLCPRREWIAERIPRLRAGRG